MSKIIHPLPIRRLLGTAAAAVAAAAFAPGAAAAQSADEFYKSATMELTIPGSPGGGYDTYARSIGRYIVKYIPGNPSLVPRHRQGAGGLVAANWLYNNAPRDGSVIAAHYNDAVTTTALYGHENARFKSPEFGWLGSPVSGVSVCVAWHASGITSFEQMRQRKVIAGGIRAGQGNVDLPMFLNNVLGTQIQIVTGYPAGTAVNLAMERGEVEARCGWSWSSVQAIAQHWLDEKRINVLLQFGLRKHPDLPDVPLVADLADSPEQRALIEIVISPDVVGRPFSTTPGVPADRLKVLRDAFAATVKDAEFLAEAKKQNIEIAPISAEDVEQMMINLFKTPPELVKAARESVVRTDRTEIIEKKSDKK